MSLKRKFHFTCDFCDDGYGKEITVIKEGYGLPEGWIWIKSIGEIQHACEDCKENIPVEKHGQSGKLS